MVNLVMVPPMARVLSASGINTPVIVIPFVVIAHFVDALYCKFKPLLLSTAKVYTFVNLSVDVPQLFELSAIFAMLPVILHPKVESVNNVEPERFMTKSFPDNESKISVVNVPANVVLLAIAVWFCVLLLSVVKSVDRLVTSDSAIALAPYDPDVDFMNPVDEPTFNDDVVSVPTFDIL